MTRSNQLDFATRCIHAGQAPDPTTGAVMMPIYATSTYVQQSPGVNKGYDYARTRIPRAWRSSAASPISKAAAPRSPLRPAWRRFRRRSNASTRAPMSSRSTTSMAARAVCSSGCASARWESRSAISICPTRMRSKRRSGRTPAWSGSRRRPIRSSSWSTSSASPHRQKARHLGRRRQYIRQSLCAASA